MTSAISIRGDRDRFVAFAFASADLLLEIDADGRICFAAGATRRIFDQKPDQLVSSKLGALICPDDRAMVATVLASIQRGGRFAPLLIRVGSDQPRPAILGGCRIPERSAHYFLSLSVPVRGQSLAKPGSALLDSDRFLERAQSKLTTGGGSQRMSLITLDGFSSLKERTPENLREGLPTAVASQFLATSAAIDEIGEIAEGKYGLLHTGPLQIEELRQAVDSFASGLDPSGAALKLDTTTLELARGTLSESDAARAVVHAVAQFARAGGSPRSFASLQDSFASLIGASAQHVSILRQVIGDGGFSIALQPIVDLSDDKVVHLEALSRFGQGSSPLEIVSLAEDIGMIADFDLAVCRRVLNLLQGGRFRGLPIAVNVSGRSWADEGFVSSLIKMLEGSEVASEKLVFEITETAGIVDLPRANNVIQSLRERGYLFCLDDFGAGASSFHYLRGLEVDYVKIDGQFCRDAMNQPRARALLSTVVRFCSDHSIKPVGEMIETRYQATVLKKLGLQFGQGYLFGKPKIIESPRPISVVLT